MTHPNDRHDLARPDEQVHFPVARTIPTKAGSFTAFGANVGRGMTITLTADIIEAQRDRHGDLSRSWVALLHDEDAQVARFGQVIVRPGPWLADEEIWIHGIRVGRWSGTAPVAPPGASPTSARRSARRSREALRPRPVHQQDARRLRAWPAPDRARRRGTGARVGRRPSRGNPVIAWHEDPNRRTRPS